MEDSKSGEQIVHPEVGKKKKFKLISQGGKPPLSRDVTDFAEMERRIAAGVSERRAKDNHKKETMGRVKQGLSEVGLRHSNRLVGEADAQRNDGTLLHRQQNQGLRERLRGGKRETITEATWSVGDERFSQYDVSLEGRDRKTAVGIDFIPKKARADVFGFGDRSYPLLRVEAEFSVNDVQEIPENVRLQINPEGIRQIVWRKEHLASILGGDTPLGEIIADSDDLSGEHEYNDIQITVNPSDDNSPAQLRLGNSYSDTTVGTSVYDYETDSFSFETKLDYKRDEYRKYKSLDGKDIVELYDQILSLIPDNPNH